MPPGFMNATTGVLPAVTTDASLTCASAMRSPSVDSPAADVVRVAVMLPSTLLAIGAIKVLYVLMIEVSSAALGTSRVTIMLLAVTDERTMSWVRRSYLKLVSVKSRPKDAAEVTSRCWPFGSGTLQTYGAWV